MKEGLVRSKGQDRKFDAGRTLYECEQSVLLRGNSAEDEDSDDG
jgi:hypothetical protein